MSMREWAKREVEIACKREAPDTKDDEWDYGCSCYESALKAYLSLMDDDHSGFSFGLTRNILKRLLDEKPLTPIEDTPDIWNDITSKNEEGTITYRCKRMSGFFKDVYSDGRVKYYDIKRYYCKDLESRCTYSCGLESSILNDMYPITMPYYPDSGFYVFTTRELLTNRNHGDFDTKAILTLKHPDGTLETIERYFAAEHHGWREIDKEEYDKRYKMHMNRIEKERENESEQA